MDIGNPNAITIPAIPTGYELSTDAMGGAYSSDIRNFAFPADISGNVDSFNLYVRLAATANHGDGGNIQFDGILNGGAAAPPVFKATGSATVTAPSITDGVDVSGLSTYQGIASSSDNFTTSATCLSANLVVNRSFRF